MQTIHSAVSFPGNHSRLHRHLFISTARLRGCNRSETPRLPRCAHRRFGGSVGFHYAPETITVDKWFRPASVPTRELDYHAAVISGPVSPFVTSPTSVIDWLPDYPDQFAKAPSLSVCQQGIIHGFAVLSHLQPRNYEDPLLPHRSPRPVSGEMTGPVVAGPEAVSVDRFAPEYPARIDHVSLTQPSASTGPLNIQDEHPYWRPEYPDKLAQPYPLAIYQKASIVPYVQPTILLESFQAFFPARALGSKPVPSEQIVEPFPQVALDWLPDYPNQIARKADVSSYTEQGDVHGFTVLYRLQPRVYYPDELRRRAFKAALASGMAPFLTIVPYVPPPPAPPLDGWVQPASEPTRLLARCAALGECVIDPDALTNPEVISADKFHPVYPDWIARSFEIAMYAASGAVFDRPIPLPNVIAEACTSTQFRAEGQIVLIGAPPKRPEQPAPFVTNGMDVAASTSPEIAAESAVQWNGPLTVPIEPAPFVTNGMDVAAQVELEVKAEGSVEWTGPQIAPIDDDDS